MKTHLSINTVVLFTFFFLGGCSLKKRDCSNDICFKTSVKKEKDQFLVNLLFSSEIDTSLCLNEKTLIIGCPFYQESEVLYKAKPTLDDLNFSQIIIENEEGGFRVFSSPFVDNNGEAVITMPNCAFMGKKRLVIKQGHIERVRLGISNLNDLKVKENDKKNRLHLYYKESPNKGAILTSTNWISTNE